MDAHLLLFGIDVIAIVTVATVGTNFLVSQPDNTNARLWAFICFNTVCYLLFSRYIHAYLIPEPYQIDLGMFVVLARFVMNLTPGLFMVLACTLFLDGRKLPQWLLVLFVLQVLLEEPLPLLLSIEVAQGDLLFETFPAALQILFAGVALLWAVDNWRADLVEERRRLRFIFLVVAGLYIIASVLFGRVLVAMEVVSPLSSYVVLSAGCALLGLASVFSMFQGDTRFFTQPGRRQSPQVNVEEDHLIGHDLEAIRCAFEEERVYREGGLTVSQLAAKLTIPEYRLRKRIHQELGYQNFNALLHHYRVREAAQHLQSVERRNVPILTIALSVGYQSVNPFNRAFRKLKGMSPSEFRTKSLAVDGH